jgi:hypothetical protein
MGRGQALDGGVGPGVLVAVDDSVGLAALAWNRDRDELVGELPGLVSSDGAVM